MNRPLPHPSVDSLSTGPVDRLPAKARLDLHLHSDRSDGKLPPDELLRRCAEGRLDLVALTDHDLVPSLAAGWQTVAGRRIRVVHGAEVSGVHRGKELHLLVYFPDEMPASFRAFLDGRARFRAERYESARRSIGLPGVTEADAAAFAGARALTRHHLARALVEAGHVGDTAAAFRHFTATRHGHVPPVDVSFVDVIRTARAAGGFTSWAHPSLGDAELWAPALEKEGLQALEASRPGLGLHGRGVLSRLARKLGLLTTGGSDWHGWTGGAPGQYAFPLREAGPLLAVLGIAH
jgi:predicted metal-dependent phosphoesterase TrpH